MLYQYMFLEECSLWLKTEKPAVTTLVGLLLQGRRKNDPERHGLCNSLIKMGTLI
jgi:hypothetical protein